MEYRQLGRSGVRVSPICLGTAFRAFWQGHNDEKTCIETIERAVDLGINFIDCANYYFAGRCETVLGKALKGLGSRRENLVVTSKVWSRIGQGTNDQGLSRYHIMREAERSLRRLQVDHIDLYLMHHWDPVTPLEESLRAMDDLVRQGKVRYIGACNFTAAQVVEALWVSQQHNFNSFVCLQNPYNLLDRAAAERELLGRCRQHGLGMMTYSPLAVGLLSGIFRRGKVPPKGTLWGERGAKALRQAMTPQADRIVAALVDIAAGHGKTPAQAAFAWLLDHPEVTPITGPDLPEHVEEVCGALDMTLAPDERKVLDDLSAWQEPRHYA
jgi:1-deoxyxylulose-5-phosphate synthase